MNRGHHRRPSPVARRRPARLRFVAPVAVFAGAVAVLAAVLVLRAGSFGGAGQQVRGAATSPTAVPVLARTSATAAPRTGSPTPTRSAPSTVSPPRVVDTDGLRARRAGNAVAYALSHGMDSSVAVLDTRTGRLSTAGDPLQTYPSASVVKTLIASRLLLEGRMSGAVASLAWAMITRSDNKAADTLYPLVGGDALVPYLSRYYGVASLGAPPAFPTFWGSTRISARGMALFYDAVRHDPTVWPWLSNAMHHYEARTAVNEPNNFGLAAAVPSAAVKNGWNEFRDPARPKDAQINSTGFVDDRYAVVILSEGPDALYFTGGEAVVTAEAGLLFPT